MANTRPSHPEMSDPLEPPQGLLHASNMALAPLQPLMRPSNTIAESEMLPLAVANSPGFNSNFYQELWPCLKLYDFGDTFHTKLAHDINIDSIPAEQQVIATALLLEPQMSHLFGLPQPLDQATTESLMPPQPLHISHAVAGSEMLQPGPTTASFFISDNCQVSCDPSGPINVKGMAHSSLTQDAHLSLLHQAVAGQLNPVELSSRSDLVDSALVPVSKQQPFMAPGMQHQQLLDYFQVLLQDQHVQKMQFDQMVEQRNATVRSILLALPMFNPEVRDISYSLQLQLERLK